MDMWTSIHEDHKHRHRDIAEMQVRTGTHTHTHRHRDIAEMQVRTGTHTNTHTHTHTQRERYRRDAGKD